MLKTSTIGIAMIPKISAKNALIPLQTMFYPLEPYILELTNLYGTKIGPIIGKKRRIRNGFIVFHTYLRYILHLVLLRWSPGLIFSSIIPTPQPRPKPKWFSAFVALFPQDQQNSYLQKPQVIWLQPLFFSIRVRHIGHSYTLSLFSSAQPASYLFSASSHVTSSPCHSSLQLKQTWVLHFWQVKYLIY